MSRDPETSNDAGPRRTRDLFDRASNGLDHGMAFRLRRARAQAQQPPARRPAFSGLVPAGLAAAALLAVGIVWWQPAPGPAPVTAVAAVSDQQEIEQLLASDEDPELYAWLADAPVATAGDRP
jgi:ferric-dicitrate binding protein FerR (iron transport regulator)